MNEFNETMRRILVSMELEELNLGEAASEVMSLDFAEWQQRAEGIYDLIQFENGVDIGGKYPLEKLEILEQKIWLQFHVKINYSADDWQLFTTGKYAENCEAIAKAINEQLEQNLMDGEASWLALYRLCDNTMAEFREYGASDTEPRGVLVDMLRRLGMPDGVV